MGQERQIMHTMLLGGGGGGGAPLGKISTLNTAKDMAVHRS